MIDLFWLIAVSAIIIGAAAWINHLYGKLQEVRVERDAVWETLNTMFDETIKDAD